MNYSALLKSKVGCAAVVAVAISGFSVSNAFAFDGDMEASVVILKEIGLKDIVAMNFGSIAKPSSGEITVQLSPAVATVATVGGTSDGRHYEDAMSSGAFTITGEPGKTANFELSVATDFTDVDVSLGNLTSSVVGTTGVALDTPIYVGGTLTVGPSADTVPAHTATIRISVTYD
ncbi:MAG: DUF4402 domain-containing protein [Bradymonadaceae bacterium]